MEKEKRSFGRELAEKFINMPKVRKELDKEDKTPMPKKGEVKEYLKSYRKQTKGQQVLKALQYQKSFGGRFQRATQYIKAPVKTLYTRNMTLAQKKAFVERMKKAKGNIQTPPKQIIIRPQISPQQRQQQDFLSWATSDFRNPRFDMASQVEKEISRSSGFAMDGDRVAHSMNINNPGFNPFRDTEAEVTRHSKALLNLFK